MGIAGDPGGAGDGITARGLVTARYNWQRDEVSIGQRDLARLWDVTERTVKREVRRLTSLGLLEVLRPGVRGRVACYRIVPEAVARLSQDHWSAVGPDFAERFAARQGRAVAQEGPSVLRVDFAKLKPEGAEDPWSRVQGLLATAAPEAAGPWFSRLALQDVRADAVEVTAGSAFVLQYIETHFGEMLRAAVAEVFGAERALVLRVG